MATSTFNPMSNLTIMHFQACITHDIQYHMEKLILRYIRRECLSEEADCCLEEKMRKMVDTSNREGEKIDSSL